MARSHRSPNQEGSTEEVNEKYERKRVGKACDRCRLKKSRCCGQQPCHRCQVDDGVCVYGERRRATEKIYAKGYTDQLVANQARLVKCVQLLYEHCVDADMPWDYPVVEIRPGSRKFLTHDILEAVGLIQPSTNEGDGEDIFRDNPEILLKEMGATEVKERKQQETIKQEAGTTSNYDTTIPTRRASMSRTSSLKSIQYSRHYLPLEKSQVPGAQPYELPMLRTSNLPDQPPDEQRTWNPVALQTASDPDMGFDPFRDMDENLLGTSQNINIREFESALDITMNH